MGRYKYKEGDQVVVGPVVRFDSDKKHIGKKGVIYGKPWTNGLQTDAKGNVYNVRIVDGCTSITIPFFEDDLSESEEYIVEDRIKHLKAELAELEKKKERITLLDLPSQLLVASSIFFPPTQLVIKVANDKWHWYHVDKDGMQFHSTSGDKAVKGDIVEYFDAAKPYEVHRPTDL